jgi:hypothetical protein
MAGPSKTKIENENGTLERRCFARGGAKLEAEKKVRNHERAYWAGVLQTLGDGRKIKGFTPDERHGLKMAVSILTGKFSVGQIRQIVQHRTGRRS